MDVILTLYSREASAASAARFRRDSRTMDRSGSPLAMTRSRRRCKR
jgi:hypothetical protein